MSDESGETEADADPGTAERPTDAAADANRNGAPERADPTAVDPDGDAVGDDERAGSDAGGDGAEETSTGGQSAGGTSEPAEPPVEAIADRIADEKPDAIAAEIAELRETVRGLEADLAEVRGERADLEERFKRKAAEFQNYKKRQETRREEVRERATEALVEDLLEVRDNLDRALDQDADADIREGVAATFRQLEEIFESQGVEPIEPEPGTDVDPTRHEVLLNVESAQPDGTVAAAHRPGYEMAGKVLRPAQVTVAEGDPE
jgi:molecular chaperone GrpE